MRRAIAGVIVVVLLLVASVHVAQAGTSTDIALGLAAFAVFNQVVGAIAAPQVVERTVVVTPPPTVVVTPPPVVYAPPPAVVTPPPVVYAPAPVVYGRPARVYEPPVYSPAPLYAPAPVVTQYRRVVHYPTGRYELRGHGPRAVWVWIPRPVVVGPAY